MGVVNDRIIIAVRFSERITGPTKQRGFSRVAKHILPKAEFFSQLPISHLINQMPTIA